MSTRAALLAVGLTLATMTPALAAPGPLDRGGVPENIVRGRALLRFRGIDAHRLQLARTSDTQAQAALRELAKRHGVRLELVRAVVLGWALVEIRDAADAKTMPTEQETQALIDRISADPVLAAASPEHWWRKLNVPNDPGMGQMWHFDAIGAEQAWDVTTGNSSQRIGIADTGLLRSHEDVGGRAVNGFDFVTDPSAANDGNGRDANFNDAGDACGNEASSFHGTHVAGTIGAAANNGKGVAGLNWNAGLVIARVLGRCGGSDVDIMEGSAWLAGAQIDGVPNVGADKVSVMNLSLGGANACSSFDQQVIDFINGQGTMFVAAAGNDAGPVGSPANCSGAITVAAFGPTNAIAGYSSFGSEVEIVGPGGDESFGQDGGVLSSIGPQAQGYAFLQGTSMATPHVVGAVSLLQAVNPGLTRAQIVAALQAGGRSCQGCNGKIMLDIPSALAAVGGGSSSPPPSTSPPPSPPSAAVADDAFEENDDLAHATVAACGVDDSTLVAAPNDLDVFTLVPPAGAQIAIAIHALHGGDLDLYVTDAAGNILARSETTTGDERITGTTRGSKLGILVNPYSDPNTGVQNTDGYELIITCGGTASTQSASDAADFVPGASDDPVDASVGGGQLGNPDPSPPEPPAADANPPAHTTIGVGGEPAAVGGCSNAGGQPLGLGAAVLLVAAGVRRRRGRG